MALSSHMLKAIRTLMKGGERVAAMGYPDIVIHPKEVESALGAKVYQLVYRDDSENITKWHRTDARKIPDSKSFFKLMDMSLEVYDVAAHRGEEIIRDLNYPLPESDLERYDMVLDVGTLEHCFNIGQAAFNMAGLVKQGGVILHENPFNWGNHGFYGLNPTWYFDFYLENGFEIVDMMMVATTGEEVKEVPQTARFGFTKAEANICCAARRLHVKPFKFPVQTKYRKMIREKQETKWPMTA